MTIEDGYHSWSWQKRVGMRGGRPVTLWSTGESHGMMGGTRETVDHVEGREEGMSTYEEEVRWSLGLVPVRGPGDPAPPRPSPNWTTFGRTV